MTIPPGFVLRCTAHNVAWCPCLDKPSVQLARLADAFVEEILAMSDEEILAEASEDGVDPDALAIDMRALFEEVAASVPRAQPVAEETQVVTRYGVETCAVCDFPIAFCGCNA